MYLSTFVCVCVYVCVLVRLQRISVNSKILCLTITLRQSGHLRSLEEEEEEEEEEKKIK